jgi:hypothetical protein
MSLETKALLIAINEIGVKSESLDEFLASLREIAKADGLNLREPDKKSNS